MTCATRCDIPFETDGEEPRHHLIGGVGPTDGPSYGPGNETADRISDLGIETWLQGMEWLGAPEERGRLLPDIRSAEVPAGYGHLVSSNWDTIVETFNVGILDDVVEWLTKAKDEALALGREGKYPVRLGDEDMQMHAKGAKGIRWYLANDDFAIMIRPPGVAWPASIRYLSAGLHEHGYAALRERALKALLSVFPPLGEDWERVSECHWAWDIWSEAFTAEMKPEIMSQVVAHSSCKKVANDQIPGVPLEMWGKGARIQTVTIAKRGQCEVQIYDKTTEIRDARRGKEWMIRLWEREGYHPPDKPADVWRVEARLRADFLRARGVMTMADVERHRHELFTEALLTRRLTQRSDTDGNRWRWALHPLWVMALTDLQRSERARPLGRQSSEAGSAIDRSLMRQLVGVARSLTVLRVGDWCPSTFEGILGELIALERADPDDLRQRKVSEASGRYRYVWVGR